MPIIQISEIRHRRGLKQDLPALAEGEVGLAVDTGELFIGTPSLPSIVRDLIAVVWQTNKQYNVGDYVAYNGVLYKSLANHVSSLTFNGSNWDEINQNDFANPNTKILTEWSKNIENILKYSYLNRNSQINTDRADNFSFHEIENFYEDLPDIWPYQAVKRVGASTYDEIGVRRYLQERLDERVSVLSYGASGNGRRHMGTPTARSRNDMDAEANAIRRATLSLANTFADDPTVDNNLRENNKAVYFPAGTYVVNKSLFLTNRTRWIGDGVGKTRIIFNINGLVLTGRKNALLMTVDKELTAEDAVNESRVQAATYQNISNLIEDIIVSGISFEIVGTPGTGSTVSSADTLRLLRASKVTFQDCEFVGNWDGNTSHSGPYRHATDSQAVGIDSVGDTVTPSNPPLYCRDIKFTNCHFDSFYYLSSMTDGVAGVTFDRCTTHKLYRGIILGETSGDQGEWATYPSSIARMNAPRNVNLFANTFKHIASHGLFVYRGYKGDGSVRPATYSEYVTTAKLDDNQKPFDQASGVTLLGNRWENVGNYHNELLVSTDNYLEDPKVPVIVFDFGTNYNSVIGDTFSRDITVLTSIDPKSRVYYNEVDPNIVLIPQDKARLPTEKRTLISRITVDPVVHALDPAAVVGYLHSDELFNSWTITYTIVYDDFGTLRRRKFGTIQVVAEPTDHVVTFTQDSTVVNGPDDIHLSVVVESDDTDADNIDDRFWVELRATFDNTLPDLSGATIYYSIEKHYAPVN